MNRIFVAILIIAALIIGWYAFSSQEFPFTETSIEQLSDNRNQGNNGSATSTAQNAVVLDENEAGDMVRIDSATLTRPGYIVIFTTSTTSESSIQGTSNLLASGRYTDVEIELTATAAGEETLVAVLFADDGNGVFEPGEDPYLSNPNLTIISDVDVVGAPAEDEPPILDQQIEFFLENATTTL